MIHITNYMKNPNHHRMLLLTLKDNEKKTCRQISRWKNRTLRIQIKTRLKMLLHNTVMEEGDLRHTLIDEPFTNHLK